MIEPQWTDKLRMSKGKQNVFNVLWRYWMLVCTLLMLPNIINEDNFFAQFVSSLIAGGVLFIAIIDWAEWYYNKYGLKSVTWHNEIHLVDERKGDDNDRAAMDKNISR